MIFKQDNHVLHFYDIVSPQTLNLNTLIKLLPMRGVDLVDVHFHPGDLDSNMNKSYDESEDTFFIYPLTENITLDMKHPTIAQA